MDTKAEAAHFVGPSNRLACRNCHFDGGRTRDTISLVGVAAKYPWAPPGGKPLGLAQKVQDCFTTELNGTAPPESSVELQSVLAYLQWISKGVPVQSRPEWLGLVPLDLQRDPDVQNGMQRFSDVCTRCHGPEVKAPPSRRRCGDRAALPRRRAWPSKPRWLRSSNASCRSAIPT